MPARPKPKLASPDTNAAAPQKARCYIRVSDTRGRNDAAAARTGREFVSPEQQLASATTLESLYGWDLDRDASLLHADLDQSGFRKHWSKRPGIMAHLADAKRGAFQILVVYKMARIGRNLREALEIFDAFAEAGVSIYAVRENVDSSTSHGRLMRNMLLTLAEWQSEDLRTTLQDAHKIRAMRGKPPTGIPAWLRRLPDKSIVLNETLAPSFRRMVELRTQWLGHVRIARMLNEEGYPTPTGVPWTAHAPLKYLSGHFVDAMVGTSTYSLADGDIIRTPDAYPRLIDDETADLLRTITQTLRPNQSSAPEEGFDASDLPQPRGAAPESRYILSARLFCGDCGGRMVPSTGGGMAQRGYKRSYRCYLGRTDETRHPDGKSTTLLADHLEDAVARVVRFALVCPPYIAPPVRPRNRPKLKPEEPPARTIKMVRDEMSELVALRLARQIDLVVYEKHYKPLEKELKGLLAAEEGEIAGDNVNRLAEVLLRQERAAAAVSEADWRAAVLGAVARVDAPITVEGVEYIGGLWKRNGKTYRCGNGVSRRCARVTLHWSLAAPDGSDLGHTFIAPLYRSPYQGEREILRADGSPLPAECAALLQKALAAARLSEN